MQKILKAGEARLLIGKRVQWEEGHDPHRGSHLTRYGIIMEVRGKNVRMGDDDWKWLPRLINLKEREDQKS